MSLRGEALEPGRPVSHAGTRRRARRIAIVLVDQLGPVLIFCAIWELVTRAGIVNDELLPRFTEVVAKLVDLVVAGNIFNDLGATLYRALAGLAIGGSFGVLVGAVMARSPAIRRTIYPLVTLTYTLPKTALIPITLLWLGVGDSSTILVVCFATFVPLVISAFHGVEAVPVQYIWSAEAMGTGRVRMIRSVMLPAALPYILNGVRTALAFSIVVVISSEMIAAFVGIGKSIFAFGQSGAYDSMFASIAIVVIAAFLMDRALAVASRRLLAWTDTEARHG